MTASSSTDARQGGTNGSSRGVRTRAASRRISDHDRDTGPGASGKGSGSVTGAMVFAAARRPERARGRPGPDGAAGTILRVTACASTTAGPR